MSVNLSACQFQGTDLVGEVRAVLEETGLDAADFGVLLQERNGLVQTN